MINKQGCGLARKGYGIAVTDDFSAAYLKYC